MLWPLSVRLIFRSSYGEHSPFQITDLGETWIQVTTIDGPPNVELCAMQVLRQPFVNAGQLDERVRMIGVGRVGGPTERIVSDDLGKTWQTISIAEHAAMAFDVQFFNRNECIIAAATNANVTQSKSQSIRRPMAVRRDQK